MLDDLRFLLDLQEIDLQMAQMEKGKQDMPAQRAGMGKEIEKAKALLDSAKKKADDVEKERKTVDAELSNERDALAKSQERLNTITTNKEYDAVHSEIETHTNKIKNAESRAASLAEEIEKLKKELEQAAAQAKEIEEKNAPEIEKVEDGISRIDSKIAEVKTVRDATSQKISKKALRTYERILKTRKNGRAVALVTMGKRNCSICFKSLPPQKVNEVRRNDELIMCESCGSILIWSEKENGKN